MIQARCTTSLARQNVSSRSPSSSSLCLLQAVRGWLGRKWYRQLRRHLPPQDHRLRSKWAAEQLQVGRGQKFEMPSDCARDAVAWLRDKMLCC